MFENESVALPAEACGVERVLEVRVFEMKSASMLHRLLALLDAQNRAPDGGSAAGKSAGLEFSAYSLEKSLRGGGRHPLQAPGLVLRIVPPSPATQTRTR